MENNVVYKIKNTTINVERVYSGEKSIQELIIDYLSERKDIDSLSGQS